ncbi:MAG: HD domain-containing phosphohydrolase [Planctomycetota bacterium]|jgi:response regulator RpfG family c-di-GMP phosphodiesterase
MVVLNLFYLPVLLAAFFLGRYRAGILALLCVISASVVTALDLLNFAAYTSPTVIALALTIWGAALGLNAILAGTLSDQRSQKMGELHDAYVGVVEVLSQYLNRADPKLKDGATRVSELSQKVAARMRLSEKETDDIRVAALLQNIENIEVTTKVIRKAIGDLKGGNHGRATEHTFRGSDLVYSLGSVLTGALPLLSEHEDTLDFDLYDERISDSADAPFGAKIIRTVRTYDATLHRDSEMGNPQEAINAIKNDVEGGHHPAVVHALEQVVLDSVSSCQIGATA